MVESESSVSAAAANVVEGFSARFNLLLDLANFPKKHRISAGAERFKVVPNTFKAWCVSDRIPGSHSVLLELVETLLREVPGSHNPKAVAAWLLAGDAVPNPFGDDTNALAFVELYLQIAKVAKRERIEFDRLPREVRNLILKRVRSMLPESAAVSENGLRLSDAQVAMAIAMLETARTMA